MVTYYEKHREACLKKVKEYQNTKIGKATKMLHDYRRKDKYYNRGEGDLTAQWIVDNILSKSCVHCGESDWAKIGCNRLDNSKPHTMDNVEPCCADCNNKLHYKELSKHVYQYTLDGELVNVWESASEAARQLGFTQTQISRCCNGGRFLKGKWINIKQAYGYRWSYVPL